MTPTRNSIYRSVLIEELTKNVQTLLAGLTLPVVPAGKPELVRDVAFIAENLEAIAEYGGKHPEVRLQPYSHFLDPDGIRKV